MMFDRAKVLQKARGKVTIKSVHRLLGIRDRRNLSDFFFPDTLFILEGETED